MHARVVHTQFRGVLIEEFQCMYQSMRDILHMLLISRALVQRISVFHSTNNYATVSPPSIMCRKYQKSVFEQFD